MSDVLPGTGDEQRSHDTWRLLRNAGRSPERHLAYLKPGFVACCSLRRLIPCREHNNARSTAFCSPTDPGSFRKMRSVIGLPKEIKTDEHRVALTPLNVKSLVALGFTVHVERGAGEGSGFLDDEYLQAGACMEDTHAAVFHNSQLIVKVKEPIESEYPLIRAHHTVFTFFHFAGSRKLTEAMMHTGAVCIAYETIEKADGSLPILAPMSEIAGRLSVQMGMRFLEKPQGGSGVLLGGVPGVLPGSVVVIGGGVAGANAALVAAGVGADVVLLDNNVARLRALTAWMPRNVRTAFSSSSSIEQHLLKADLAVGAALVAGAKTPVLVSEALLRRMKPGSVFVDIAIDQGGMTQASKPTTHRDPVIRVGDVSLYCVANMPGCVPRTSTEAITSATMPYLVDLATHGWGAALASSPELMKGLNVAGGKVTYDKVAKLFELPFFEPEPLALAAAREAAGGIGNGNGQHHGTGANGRPGATVARALHGAEAGGRRLELHGAGALGPGGLAARGGRLGDGRRAAATRAQAPVRCPVAGPCKMSRVATSSSMRLRAFV